MIQQELRSEDGIGGGVARLAAERKLLSYRHDGFWLAMDTFKDKMTFDHMYEKGIAPWEVWKARRNLVGANPYVYSGDGR